MNLSRNNIYDPYGDCPLIRMKTITNSVNLFNKINTSNYADFEVYRKKYAHD